MQKLCRSGHKAIVNIKGKCSGQTTLTWSYCQNGGYRDPNSNGCSKCKCPDGWAPPNCLQPISSSRKYGAALRGNTVDWKQCVLCTKHMAKWDSWSHSRYHMFRKSTSQPQRQSNIDKITLSPVYTICFSTCSQHIWSEDGAFTRCVVHICFWRICICFPAISHYTRVLTMDEFDILAPILLIIMVGANILFFTTWRHSFLEWEALDRFHWGRALSVSLGVHFRNLFSSWFLLPVVFVFIFIYWNFYL